MIERRAAGGLSLSALALVGLLNYEGYTDTATIPTKNDVPTVGFGTTQYNDGDNVKVGDTIDPLQAVVTAQKHINTAEIGFKASLPGVKLTQAEYDLYIDFLYQYGIGNWQSSSMRRELLNNNHKAACDALLKWRYAGGYDCSTTIDGQPNKRCWGVWQRQLDRHSKCLQAQK